MGATFALLLAVFIVLPAAAQIPSDSLQGTPVADALPPLPPTAQPDTTLPLLALDEAVAQVLTQNPDVAIARLEQAIAEVEAAPGTVGFLPRLSLTARQRRFPPPNFNPDAVGLETYSLDVNANASVTVLEGLARVPRLQRLRTLAEARAFDAAATTEALLAEALVTYFDVAQQQQQLLVLREAVALSEERVRIADGRRDVGAASDLEVRRAEVDLNADRAALLRQQTLLQQTRALLNRLLNRPDPTPYRVAAEIVVDEALRLDVLEAIALADAPDLQAAEAARDAAALSITAIRRTFWPRLDLTVGYAFSDLTEPVLAPTQIGGFNYSLTATFDLFDAGDRRRALTAARLRLDQQTQRREQTAVFLLTALQGTYARYTQSLTLVDLETENVDAARRNVAVALERFRLGASTSLELREVQRALIDAESRLVAARFDAKSAEVELRALAGLLRPDVPEDGN